MLYSKKDPSKRFAPRPHLIMDPQWRKDFSKLKGTHLAWEFELFCEQLEEAADLARHFPEIPMVLHLMGWPLDQTSDGYEYWKRQMKSMAKCPNVTLKITAIGDIFRGQKYDKIRPWVREAVEIFGPERSMYGTNMPLEGLNYSLAHAYELIQRCLHDLKTNELEEVLAQTATRFYRL